MIVDSLETRTAADRYIRALRNSAKREYAIAYRSYLTDDRAAFVEPKLTGKLSYMAAQAVRMHLDSIFTRGRKGFPDNAA